MNSCSMGEPEKHLHSSDLRSFFHELKGSPLEPHNAVVKSAKIKRRRSRRERNSARFGRNAADKISEQRSTCRRPQKMLPPFWSSQLSQCAKSTPIPAIKGTCFSKPVIITQNRLTQHLGMFNREVKSADIERLLSPRTEQVVTEVTPIQSDTEREVVMVTENQSCNANLKSIPNEEFACIGKDLNGTKEDSLPTVAEFLPISTEEHCGVANVQGVNAGSRPSTASNVEFNKQATDTEALQSSAPEVLNEMENASCSLPAQVESGKDKFPVKKLAQELQKLVDLKGAFPGRNIISETRQAVIGILQGQGKTLPNVSALVQLKKLASGCNGGDNHADVRSPERKEQEKLKRKSKSNNCRSRSSDQGIPFKKRVREQFFNSLLSSSVRTTLRTAEESFGGRESARSFAEPEAADQYSFYLTVPPHPYLLDASALHISDQTSGEHCPLNEALPWQPSGRRPDVAKRAFSKENSSKRHCVPCTVHGSLESPDLSLGSNGSGPFFMTDLQQYPYSRELSPGWWNLQETEAATILNLSEELHTSLSVDTGLRCTEREPSDSHTSFDVLKSIWSPKALSRGARRPASQALSYARFGHQPLSDRESNPRPRQPEEFFQVFGSVPQQRCFCGQNPQPEACVPGTYQQHGDTFSVLANPRTFCPKVSGKQGRPSNGQQVWGLVEDPERMQRRRETESSNPDSQIWELERLVHMESAQQLQAFQQLPMSYFPPSEALGESTDFPLCTSQGHLLGQASPEPWTFPRMKLY